ncbi:MAG: hypothetical protein IJ914_10795 [Prevotella sp.]|nr:hypothetical protein [Prevotella sp.]
MSIIADIFIIVALAAIVVALALTFWSVAHSLKLNKRKYRENGVPVGTIGWATFGLLMVIALPTLLFMGYANMCIITSIVLFIVAITALLYDKLVKSKP